MHEQSKSKSAINSTSEDVLKDKGAQDHTHAQSNINVNIKESDTKIANEVMKGKDKVNELKSMATTETNKPSKKFTNVCVYVCIVYAYMYVHMYVCMHVQPIPTPVPVIETSSSSIPSRPITQPNTTSVSNANNVASQQEQPKPLTASTIHTHASSQSLTNTTSTAISSITSSSTTQPILFSTKSPTQSKVTPGMV